MDQLFLDVETDGLNPFYGNRLTCICAKSSTSISFKTCLDSENEMLTYFYEFLSGLKEFELVTKNGRMFDVPFLVWRSILWNKEEEAKQLLMLDHFDLHDLTKKWVGLDDMARLLKVEGKKGNGLDAIGLFRTKNYDKLIDYCYHDVQVTEQIYKRYKSLPYISAEGESIGE